jgi:hypothetical protein
MATKTISKPKPQWGLSANGGEAPIHFSGGNGVRQPPMKSLGNLTFWISTHKVTHKPLAGWPPVDEVTPYCPTTHIKPSADACVRVALLTQDRHLGSLLRGDKSRSLVLIRPNKQMGWVEATLNMASM